jgi:hypothetical protein
MGAGRESLIGQTAVQGPVVRSRVSTARPRGMDGLPSSGCTGAGPPPRGIEREHVRILAAVTAARR